MREKIKFVQWIMIFGGTKIFEAFLFYKFCQYSDEPEYEQIILIYWNTNALKT